MRILVAITVFVPSQIYGGPATVAFNQAEELVGRGHDVTVITSDVITLRPRQHCEAGERCIRGVRVIYFPTWIVMRRFPALVSLALWRWVRGAIEKYDIVHVHFARDWIPITVSRVALRHGVKLFLQPHGMLGRQDGLRRMVDRLAIRWLLRRANGVLALQDQEGENIASIAKDARIFIVPNGATLNVEDGCWSVESLGRRTVLFLARLHPQKRVSVVIEAAKLLRDAGVGIRVRIVGPDEGDLAIAQRRVLEYGLQDAVEFIGAVPPEQVKTELVNASLYVLPTLAEAFPMTVLEAMACGVPSIVTDGVCISGLLKSHQAARVVSPDVKSIADAIAEILDKPALAAQLSKNGRQLVRNELTIEKVVSQLERIYRSV